MRVARSRTSGENLFVVLLIIAPSTQELEPPAIPGRFKTDEMKKHTEDFKQEAVRIALTSGLSRQRVAADLGVGLSTLGRWVSQYRPTDLVAAPQADLARENERLRLENRILKEEREILKKATQFFASGLPWGSRSCIAGVICGR